jgi:hypothetical protein
MTSNDKVERRAAAQTWSKLLDSDSSILPPTTNEDEAACPLQRWLDATQLQLATRCLSRIDCGNTSVI